MTIELMGENDVLITSFDLDANPFKVGENIHVEVDNQNKQFWTIDGVKDTFKILNIEHHLRQTYSPNGNYGQVFVVSVSVEPLGKSKKYKVTVERKQNNVIISVKDKIIESERKPKVGEGGTLLVNPPIYETVIGVKEI